jgi:hypothetical protein
VWPDAVVVAAPSLDQHLGLLEAVEDLAVEELVPELCSDTPIRRQISPTVLPCAKSTSASRRWLMICSTENRFLDIRLPLLRKDPDAANL